MRHPIMNDDEKLTVLKKHTADATGDARLGLLRELLLTRVAFKSRFEIHPLDDESRKKRLMQGEPLVRRSELFAMLPLMVRQWQGCEKLFRNHSILSGESCDPGQLLSDFLQEKVNLSDMASQYGAKGELLHYIMMETLKPVYERYVEAYGKRVDDSTWTEPFCYVCGGSPGTAVLSGDEGRRYLCCSLCETEWRYDRFRCVYCGNDDMEKLVVLTLGDQPSYLLHGCRACDRYTKVIDMRTRSGDLFLELEDILSGTLDVVARNEGFRGY